MNLPWHRMLFPGTMGASLRSLLGGHSAGSTGKGKEWESPLQTWGKPTHTPPHVPLHPGTSTQHPGPPCSQQLVPATDAWQITGTSQQGLKNIN